MRTLRVACALALFALAVDAGRSAAAHDNQPNPRASARHVHIRRPSIDPSRAVGVAARLERTEAATAYVLGNQPPPPPPPPPPFVCPVQGPMSFVDSWGDRRSGGRRHEGVDMMSPEGTPVVAPVAGTVTLRGSRVGGLSFHLDGVDGTYYYGTHLSAYGAEGEVAQGTVVGYVGGTGNAHGTPHLHFEIHPGGRGNAVNPYPTVAQYCTQSA